MSGLKGAALLSDERWARVAWTCVAEPAEEAFGEQLRRRGAVDAFQSLLAAGPDGLFGPGDSQAAGWGTGRANDRRAGLGAGFATGLGTDFGPGPGAGPGLGPGLGRGAGRGAGRGPGLWARISCLDLEGVRRALDLRGIRVVIPGDDDWPPGLDDLAVPPYALYVRGGGTLDLLEGSIAVVGARAASSYGQRVAAGLGADLAARGVTVVSGAAFGIDAAAHRGALSADGPTVAVLACGLDRPYPTAHAALLNQVAESGLLVGELPPGFAPLRHRFLSRNRLIAALSVGTVVVEAALRSGSLNTAKHARDLGRHVAMVPGPVTSATSAGCHEWIRVHDSNLVTDARDVLDVMGRLGVDVSDLRRAAESAIDALEPDERIVWAAVPFRAGVRLDALARTTGLASTPLLAVLGRLLLAGLVRRDGDRWRRPAPGSSAGSGED